jgi:hypothetical protein
MICAVAAKKGYRINPRAGVAWRVSTYSAMGRHDDAIAATQRAAEYAPPWTLRWALPVPGQPDGQGARCATLLKRPATAYM